jgi:hypothetical protein
VREFFGLACQHLRRERNDRARRLNNQPAAVELWDGPGALRDDEAEALRLYQEKRGDSQRSQNAAAEIKLRAERRIDRLRSGVGR